MILPNEEDDRGAYIAADKDGIYRIYAKDENDEPVEITDYMALYDNAHDKDQEIFIGEKFGDERKTKRIQNWLCCLIVIV